MALNAERVKEEKEGTIRWLRPDYQKASKAERKMIQDAFAFDDPAPKKGKTTKAEAKATWPSGMLEQTQAVRTVIDVLRTDGVPITLEAVAERFTRAKRDRVQEILQALETLGFV